MSFAEEILLQARELPMHPHGSTFSVEDLANTPDRKVPHKHRLVGGVKGHNMNETSFPGSPALWAGSFTPPNPDKKV